MLSCYCSGQLADLHDFGVSATVRNQPLTRESLFHVTRPYVIFFHSSDPMTRIFPNYCLSRYIAKGMLSIFRTVTVRRIIPATTRTFRTTAYIMSDDKKPITAFTVRTIVLLHSSSC
jgi:hypothetical protein